MSLHPIPTSVHWQQMLPPTPVAVRSETTIHHTADGVVVVGVDSPTGRIVEIDLRRDGSWCYSEIESAQVLDSWPDEPEGPGLAARDVVDHLADRWPLAAELCVVTLPAGGGAVSRIQVGALVTLYRCASSRQWSVGLSAPAVLVASPADLVHVADVAREQWEDRHHE